MSSSASWPPALKEWVAKCLGNMTESNKAEAQAELRKVIADAFAKHTLWTTDWAGVQLQSLLPKPIAVPSLKRKNVDHTLPHSEPKKSKKASKLASSASAPDVNDMAALNRRAERFQREHEIERQKTAYPTSRLNSNVAISRNPSSLYAVPDDSNADPNVLDWDKHTIVGTSTEMFKDYLRLTSEPKPETIRPYEVLKATHKELCKRWVEKTVTYSWICNQLKSVRQDLTVQRIKNELTVKVYETHARLALESADMVEFNQCQSTLKTLYELGIPGYHDEFTAYRILMLLHGRNRSELNLYVGQLTSQQKSHVAIHHALAVQRALIIGNYHSLFALYKEAPAMSGFIMDHFITRERAKALVIISKSYKTIPLAFLNDELAFDELDDALRFLTEHAIATFTNPNSPDTEKVLDLKAAYAELKSTYESKYKKVNIRGAI